MQPASNCIVWLYLKALAIRSAVSILLVFSLFSCWRHKPPLCLAIICASLEASRQFAAMSAASFRIVSSRTVLACANLVHGRHFFRNENLRLKGHWCDLLPSLDRALSPSVVE
ncbi:hypothetical protein BDW69DRAFT_16488 [Aspergillus filifer]